MDTGDGGRGLELIPCEGGCVAFGPEDMSATTYEDGPILIRGAEGLIDADGRLTPVVRRVVAVCRCGRSSRAPLCDGTHRFVFPGVSERSTLDP